MKGNRLFVHAGFDPALSLEHQGLEAFLWDRELARAALRAYGDNGETVLTNFEEVYIGHTPIASPVPVRGGGVWLMDTGAGWSGVLSIMDIDSKAVFTSDPVPQLYPGVKGRKKH